jgi:5-methylcytosine-specific restriction endonuclease McrA
MNPARTQQDALLYRCRRLLSDHRTRAKAAGCVLDYTIDDLRRLIASAPCCRWCKLPVDLSVSVDHVQPTSRGGPHALHNLAVVCRRCQRLKGMLTGAEMEFLLELLDGLHPVARADMERRLLSGGARYRITRKENG